VTTEQPEQPATARKRKPSGIEPWTPPEYDDLTVIAIKAVANGTASDDQQRRAMRFIVEQVCATYDLSFRPGGLEGARATDFAEGRRFTGTQIVKLINLPLNAIRKAQGKPPLEQPD
jgi:hypothetical protein